MKKASSKKSTRKSTPKKGSFFDSKHVYWFGIDIHHIALGVSFVGCIIALLLVQKQKAIEEQVLAVQTTATGVSYVRVGGMPICEGGNCANITPVPRLTCIPRPPCLDATPRCMIAEPADGWCPPAGTPTPSVTPPQGCYYKKICLMIMCTRNNPNCQPCHQILVCPSGTPYPTITIAPPVRPSCEPSPTCDPRKGILCKLPCGVTPPVSSPKITGSVPVGSSLPSSNPSATSSISSFFTNFLNKFFSFF